MIEIPSRGEARPMGRHDPAIRRRGGAEIGAAHARSWSKHAVCDVSASDGDVGDGKSDVETSRSGPSSTKLPPSKSKESGWCRDANGLESHDKHESRDGGGGDCGGSGGGDGHRRRDGGCGRDGAGAGVGIDFGRANASKKCNRCRTHERWK